jgi:hypothetical protein
VDGIVGVIGAGWVALGLGSGVGTLGSDGATVLLTAGVGVAGSEGGVGVVDATTLLAAGGSPFTTGDVADMSDLGSGKIGAGEPLGLGVLALDRGPPDAFSSAVPQPVNSVASSAQTAASFVSSIGLGLASTRHDLVEFGACRVSVAHVSIEAVYQHADFPITHDRVHTVVLNSIREQLLSVQIWVDLGEAELAAIHGVLLLIFGCHGDLESAGLAFVHSGRSWIAR